VREQSEKNQAATEQGRFDEDLDYMDDLEVIDPVTGWLVCFEGPQMGRDYRIMAEKNFIGRAEDMHIQIIGDNKIARRNHAIIAYDPMKRKTLLLPGDSSGLVYLNDEAVYTPTELSAFHVIQLGASKFLFIPLCGEHFEWGNVTDANNDANTNTDSIDSD
jgi:hypothetical protein